MVYAAILSGFLLTDASLIIKESEIIRADWRG